ncbi:MAG: CFI-box-CTERM domain-containing protein, partial [Candidatus Brocadiia bacterium]
GNPATGDMTVGDNAPDNGNPGTSSNVDWTGGGGGGCFIATAAFGSYGSDSVRALTSVRDSSLAGSGFGSGLVSLYYSVSPMIANDIASSNSLRALVRSIIE